MVVFVGLMWFLWIFGLILQFSNDKDIDVHKAYWLMWGYRMTAFGVMGSLIHKFFVIEEWDAFWYIYVVMMSLLFLHNAVMEHRTNYVFKVLFHEYMKKEIENKLK